MFDSIDLLIIGAGPVGCVIAERAATQLGWRSLIVEKRNHIAGNCYDRYHESGILIHQYGPHYFRTNKTELIDYLSQFTSWIPGNYIVQSYTQGQFFPIPINLTTLEKFFNRRLTPAEAQQLLENEREPIASPTNSEEFVLSRIGRPLYEAFYLGYTLKQWELHPKDLSPSVLGRIPVRLNNDNRYVDHRFQVMPEHGFTAMFSKMIQHPLINVVLQTDYRDVRSHCKPRYATIYCGPIDEYFDYTYGALPWRSLNFEFKTYDQEYLQTSCQVNYPNDYAYTRTFESKHVTKQKHAKTTISYEYPSSIGDPYYPIPRPANDQLYQRYKQLADQETQNKNVFFAGRLAQYLYMNTDEAIECALQTFEKLKTLSHPSTEADGSLKE